MADGTGIAWTDATWNCIRGCSRVSAGCVNCYAERQAIRHAGPGGAYEGLARMVNGHPTWTGQIRLVPELLAKPLRWRKPRRVFVNSMSDLFHEEVDDYDLDRLFAVMGACPQHTFQVLTKRPRRAWEYLNGQGDMDEARIEMIRASALEYTDAPEEIRWPLPNVHLGVSVEDQPTADERILLLLDTPAAVRFVSYEPALGPVDFTSIKVSRVYGSLLRNAFTGELRTHAVVGLDGVLRHQTLSQPGNLRFRRHIDWLIVGGESGPGARPCDVEWIRGAVQQCREAGVACFVKQLGARPVSSNVSVLVARDGSDGRHQFGFTDRKGADPTEWPADLRVQEFPA